MKKILSMILTVALIVSLGSIVAFAQTRGSNGHLFIETPECPQGYVEFAEDTIVGFIESQCEGNMPYSSVTIGRPFAFLDYGSDVYYFPVICDGVIEYIFRVYPSQNTGYDAAISSFLAAELESLAKETSVRRPMKFSSVGNKIIATIGNAEHVLFTYPEDISDIPSPTNSCTQGSIATIVIDAKSDVGIDVAIQHSAQRTGSWEHYINLNITEIQGQNSWCAAYCTATILRTLGQSSTAEGVMSIFYRKPKTTDSISREQVVTYLNMLGLNPFRVEATVAYEILRDELRSNRPVYLSMASSGSNHAVVLRGYNSRYSKWSIWNPWFASYETFSMNGTYVPTGRTGSYTYARTIYHWAP